MDRSISLKDAIENAEKLLKIKQLINSPSQYLQTQIDSLIEEVFNDNNPFGTAPESPSPTRVGGARKAMQSPIHGKAANLGGPTFETPLKNGIIPSPKLPPTGQ